MISPRLLTKIKNEVLGKDYDLSFSFVSEKRIHELNRTYRQLDKATDILSFPLSEKEGEIYICKSEADKEAPKFGRNSENFILFLYIHGLVHLKGFDHSSTMESIEAGIRKTFGI